MRDTSGDKLGGAGKIVEADEVYIGGKNRKGVAKGVKRDLIVTRPLPCWWNAARADARAQLLSRIRSAAC